METEIWKDIKDLEGIYEVSSHGKVRVTKTGLIRKPFLHNGKWYKVTLHKKDYKKHHRIHRLVAKAFIPNPDNKPEVNHKDFNKLNNHVDNLEWMTGEENIKHYRDTLC